MFCVVSTSNEIPNLSSFFGSLSRTNMKKIIKTFKYSSTKYHHLPSIEIQLGFLKSLISFKIRSGWSKYYQLMTFFLLCPKKIFHVFLGGQYLSWEPRNKSQLHDQRQLMHSEWSFKTCFLPFVLTKVLFAWKLFRILLLYTLKLSNSKQHLNKMYTCKKHAENIRRLRLL